MNTDGSQIYFLIGRAAQEAVTLMGIEFDGTTWSTRGYQSWLIDKDVAAYPVSD